MTKKLHFCHIYSIRLARSSICHNFVVTPASIAGVTLRVLWICSHEVIVHKMQSNRKLMIFDLF